jgi:hypothetical protein
MHLLGRLVDALEDYARIAPPSVSLLGPGSGFEPIAGAILDQVDDEPPPAETEPRTDPDMPERLDDPRPSA